MPAYFLFFFFSSRRRHTRSDRDWSSDVCSSDLGLNLASARSTNGSLGQTLFGSSATVGGAFPLPPPAFDRDRKSTRLNSSHDQISYAVFCLKKKKKIRSVDLLTYRLIAGI